MLEDKLKEVQKKHDDCSAREKEIILHINANSAKMSVEELQKLEKERREYVAARRKVRSQIAAIKGLQPRKISATAREALKELLE